MTWSEIRSAAIAAGALDAAISQLADDIHTVSVKLPSGRERALSVRGIPTVAEVRAWVKEEAAR